METYVCNTRVDLEGVLSSALFKQRWELERQIATANSQVEEFHLSGFCRVCDRAVGFSVDRRYASFEDGLWIPNWREQLVCPSCKLNNRQRVIAKLVMDAIRDTARTEPPNVYLMEQVTPLFRLLRDRFPHCPIEGSEYLGPNLPPGTYTDAVRHENVEQMTFADRSFDLVVSNDVLEHANDPFEAFRETARVLREGALLLMTVPFHWQNDKSGRRARIGPNGIEHMAPPTFHGNPLSSDGSLVFTDFGWDMLSEMRKCGFREVCLRIYWSLEFGHIGGLQFYFEARK